MSEQTIQEYLPFVALGVSFVGAYLVDHLIFLKIWRGNITHFKQIGFLVVFFVAFLSIFIPLMSLIAKETPFHR